jgi:hypothetical protein
MGATSTIAARNSSTTSRNRDQRTSVTLPNGVVQTMSYRNNGAPNVIDRLTSATTTGGSGMRGYGLAG